MSGVGKHTTKAKQRAHGLLERWSGDGFLLCCISTLFVFHQTEDHALIDLVHVLREETMEQFFMKDVPLRRTALREVITMLSHVRMKNR